jgi:hypothetical protein
MNSRPRKEIIDAGYYSEGEKIEVAPYENGYYNNWDLVEELVYTFKRHIESELAALNIDAEDRTKFVSLLNAALSTPTIELPLKAPELYKERTDRKEKAEAFVRRVYAPWLGKGLLRPHLKQLDEPAYRALYKAGFPDDFETLLPTAQGRSQESLSRSDEESMQRKRTLTRASVARVRNM